MKLDTVSLFCGAGGLDLGFKEAGFNLVWSNDFDKYAVQTYRENLGNHVVYGDLNEIDPNDIPLTDVLIGGFPCQPFSMMGSELGFKDTRGTLFFRITEIIRNQQMRGNTPQVLVLENVRRLLTHDKGATFKTIIHELKELGYENINYQVLNTADYGLPQTRNRLFLVCFRNPDVVFNFPKKEELELTLQDLLEDGVDDKYFLSDRILPTILANGSGNYYSKSEIDLKVARPLCATMHKMHRACQDNYVTDGGRIRRLTPREAARLQGFPNDFVIPVSDTQAYRQFGNAVSVPVARKIAEAVLEAISE